ncbi:MAG: ribosomal protein S6 modification protein [Cyclobacteriaceae bacterium]|nr:MAG: ribosomal protein S6 modification protein [Cyclobacteriaceae bacterium]
MIKPVSKTTIGRYDKIDLPQMELFDIEAKIDTGADGSAIHCHHIELVKKKGETLLHFILLDPTHPNYDNQSFYFKDFKKRTIRNSFGVSEKRFVIATEVVVFGKKRLTEFSLSYRGNLNFPVLLGRKFLYRKFIVDVSRSNLSYRKKLKER